MSVKLSRASGRFIPAFGGDGENERTADLQQLNRQAQRKVKEMDHSDPERIGARPDE